MKQDELRKLKELNRNLQQQEKTIIYLIWD
jgi:hypothetical protein